MELKEKISKNSRKKMGTDYSVPFLLLCSGFVENLVIAVFPAFNTAVGFGMQFFCQVVIGIIGVFRDSSTAIEVYEIFF